jgi:tetratricopeptide (TPR) repeat protein
MKRTFLLALAIVATAGCAAIDNLGRDDKNAYENPFYAKYLNTGSQLDADINRTLESLRQNPDSAEAHNRLGAMLVEKGFPKDAEREFERSVDVDDDYYAAWYNLGLVRAAHGDELGARRAFKQTVDLKPGHAAALFQLGLVEEKRHHRDRAVELYAKAYSINPALMDVRVNPRILDSELMHLALLKMYPNQHSRRSMQFQGGSAAAAAPAAPATTTQEAPSPQQPASSIVTPVAPVTDPSQQAPPAPAPTPRRPRRTAPPATVTPAPAPPATNT